MLSGFFPIWLRDLRRWLSEPNVDCGQLKSWYEGWKSAFSKEMQARDVVKEHVTISFFNYEYSLIDINLLHGQFKKGRGQGGG